MFLVTTFISCKGSPNFPVVRKENKMSVYLRHVFLAAGYSLQRGVVSIEQDMQSNQCTGVHMNSFLEIVA